MGVHRRVGRTDAILEVDGAVDGLTAPRLCRAIDVAFDRLDGRPLVVDLTEVTFFGSAGLRTMAESADHAAIRRVRAAARRRRPQPPRAPADGDRRPRRRLTLFYTVADAIEGPAAG